MDIDENEHFTENLSSSDSFKADDEQGQTARPDLTNSVLFHGVAYLGSNTIQEPRSEDEIFKTISMLNDQNSLSVDVTLCVPDNANGLVRLVDPDNELEIISYGINQILFWIRAPATSAYACCWAFTTCHISLLFVDETNNKNSEKKSQTENIYQSHVFRCNNEDAIYRIMICFTNAFRRNNSNSSMAPPARRPTSFFTQAFQSKVTQLQQSNSFHSNLSTISTNNALQQQQQPFDGFIQFRTQFDIKEESIDNKGNLTLISVPKPEKTVFRLQKDLRKLVIVNLQQIRGFSLNIERCFGLLLAQGRNVPASDMQLLDLEAMTKSDDNRYIIRAYWNPSARNFKHLTYLNEETSKGARIFFTVALDVVISGIYEPVRFLIEAKACICHSNKSQINSSQDSTSTIWPYFKKVPSFTEDFDLILRQRSTINLHQDQNYEVVSLQSKSQLERQSKIRRLSSMMNSTTSNDDQSDETIPSGSGEVSKECDVEILTNWSEILIQWKKNYLERPRGLQILVRKGIPQALRCEIWQLLAGSIVNETEMIDNYRSLLTKNSASERVILNDIDRTFPSHENFKTGAAGQESLYRLSRAYSVHDEEVGYCQGLSFIIATLLIHIPEEQAFVLLCKLMEGERYHLRELYKANFENLQMRFYQLTCLIEEYLPQLSLHFDDLKIECHMFASQWFLTLFTAKFPLHFVFRIMDLFLYDGFNAIFSVALSLLKCNQKDLLSLDFEGVMRYFRVNLPKNYLNESDADDLIQTACSIKINLKKIQQYEKDYRINRFQDEERENPIHKLEVENKRLTEACLRTELETESLALELVQERLQLKENLHQAEDQIDHLKEELQEMKNLIRDSEESKVRLNEELKYIRQVFQNTCDELQRTQKSLEHSKQISAQLNDQLFRQRIKQSEKIESIQRIVCEPCQNRIQSLTIDSNVSIDEDCSISNDQISSLTASRLRQVELELAEKKLALTEALCENQELTRRLHHMNSINKNGSNRINFTLMNNVQTIT